MDVEQKAIRKLYANNAAALSTGDISALAAFYTEDVIQLPPDAPALVGWEAVHASLMNELSELTVEARIEVLEITISGDWAFARGTYRTVATQKDGEWEGITKGNWLDILVRKPDGLWRIARSTWTIRGA